MKQKELREHRRTQRKEKIMNYCNEHNLSYEEYMKAEDKETKVTLGVMWGLCVLLLGLCVLGACHENKVTTPVYNEMGLRNEAPLLAPVVGDKTLTINNNSSNINTYTIVDTYDSPDIYPGTSMEVPLLNNLVNTVVYDIDENDNYYLSDDNNLNTLGDHVMFNGETTDASFINIYDILGHDIYVTPRVADINSVYDLWLTGSVKPTGYNQTYTYTYKILQSGYYTLDFTHEYVNHYNQFDSIQVRAKVSVTGYGYQYYNTIYAYNSSNSTKVALCSNQVLNKASDYVYVSGNNLDLIFNATSQDANTSSNTVYYMPRYLNTLKLHSVSYFNLSQNYGLRAWLDNDAILVNRYVEYNVNGTDEVALWSMFGDLLTVVLMSLLPLAEIRVLPMITIGALVIAPICIGFIFLIIKVVRK